MINKTRYAILGRLAQQPASGYEIKQYFDSGIAGFWKENYGHIYPMLHQMALDGDVAVQETAANGRRRLVYSITDRGLAELQSWLEQPIEETPARLELLLKLSLGRFGSLPRLIDIIGDIRRKHETRLKHLRKQEQNLLADDRLRGSQDLVLWQSIIRYGILDAEFRLQWYAETISRLIEAAAAQAGAAAAGREKQDA